MKHYTLLALTLFVTVPVQAADPIMATEQAQTQERVYGSELMTQQERVEYQNHLRTLKTEQERDAFRMEHHNLMQERAKAQNQTLPDMPASNMGSGQGMGQGKGMGTGTRRR